MGVGFHSVLVFGLGKDFLFTYLLKSIIGSCDVKKGGFMHSSQNHNLNSGDTSVINFFILFLLNKRLKSIEIK